MDERTQAYKEEAHELLAELEQALLELEETPADQDLISRVFRAMHTIKGSGAMFGFDAIAAFTHEVETAFDLVREQRIAVDKNLINLTLSARDQIKVMLDGENVDASESERIVEQFRAMVDGCKKMTGQEPDASKVAPCAAASQDSAQDSAQDFAQDSATVIELAETTYRIRFSPDSNIFRTGTNPIFLIGELGELGECKTVAQTDKIPSFSDFDPESCYTYWDIILTTLKPVDAIKDVFIFVQDDCEISIDSIKETENDFDGNYKKLGQILVERGDVREEDVLSVLQKRIKIGEMLVDAGLVDPGKVESALVEQEHVLGKKDSRKKETISSSIRVESEKLDVLVNLVGELVTVQARLTQTAARRQDPEFLLVAEAVERLTADLRDNTMSIRMLPIGTTFSKFKRVVRDLSNELGREVEMTTEGADTELDKTVIERLSDPLIHIIRNSVDHGIESPEVRQEAGKSKQGTVHLAAFHVGANVLIQIKDDGAGLDKEAIRAKAVERGIISSDAELSDKEIYGLIFAPGLSTARSVTSVSGRGVGMDVVKRGIDSLRGTIEVDSEKGKGTTITLKLPLTLAIIDGLLVTIEKDYFVLPLAGVEECMELTRQDVANAHGRHIANVRGEIVPYIHLREHFSILGNTPEVEQVVINDVNGQRIGIVVDSVVGQHQTVIKPLGNLYKNVDEVSGATMLGDGTVALILDVAKLLYYRQEQEVNAL